MVGSRRIVVAYFIAGTGAVTAICVSAVDGESANSTYIDASPNPSFLTISSLSIDSNIDFKYWLKPCNHLSVHRLSELAQSHPPVQCYRLESHVDNVKSFALPYVYAVT